MAAGGGGGAMGTQTNKFNYTRDGARETMMIHRVVEINESTTESSPVRDSVKSKPSRRRQDWPLRTVNGKGQTKAVVNNENSAE